MAEWLFDSVLEDDEGASEEELTAAEALIQADAFAATVVDRQAHNPEVAHATKLFLEEQARLKVQTRQLEDEHPLRLATLRYQALEGKLRRTGQRIRIGMQALVAFAATVLGIGPLLVLHGAF